MDYVLLFGALCVLWLGVVAATAMQHAVRAARDGGAPAGTSVFPGLPLAPLLLTGLAWGIDRWVPRAGTLGVALLMSAGAAAALAYCGFAAVKLRGSQSADPFASPAAVPMTLETASFGPVTLDEDGGSVMDGGTHGCVGHTLTASAAGAVVWERRLDSMGDPTECSGAGTTTFSDADLAEWVRLTGAAWEATARAAPSIEGEPVMEPPRWVWAIVLRRGDETRMLEGPPFGDPYADPAPEALALVDWVRAHVGAWCEASRG